MSGFSRKYRLRSKLDFQSVFAKAKKIHRKHLLVLFIPNQFDIARLGIVVGKHQVRHAADRNRLRRQVRESFRQHKDTLKGLDIIVVMRSECTPLDNKVLRDNIDRLWPAIMSSRQV